MTLTSYRSGPVLYKPQRPYMWCYLSRLLGLLCIFLFGLASNSYGEDSLPDPLDAGWKGEPVCEKLYEDPTNRIIRCTFPPGIGHERHYHVPHFQYVIAGGVMQMTDDRGTQKVEVPTAEGYPDSGTDWHEGVNVGDTTVVILMIEPKTHSSTEMSR